MFEKVYLGLVIFFFIVAFAIRNIKTAISTKLPIKGSAPILTFSIAVSTFIYLILVSRIIFLDKKYLLELDLSYFPIISYIGYAFITIGFFFGIFALLAMKNSWRVGIKHDQKTELVTNGIYQISRNPYFLSYNILIFGFILVFPSPLLLIPYLVLVAIFHKMILEEEKYLEKIHTERYLEYKKRVKRYITI